MEEETKKNYSVTAKCGATKLYIKRSIPIYIIALIASLYLFGTSTTEYMRVAYASLEGSKAATFIVLITVYIIASIVLCFIPISTCLDICYLTLCSGSSIKVLGLLASKRAKISAYEASAYSNRVVNLKATKDKLEIERYKDRLEKLTLEYPKSSKLKMINDEIALRGRAIYTYIITDIAYVCDELDKGNIDVLD